MASLVSAGVNGSSGKGSCPVTPPDSCLVGVLGVVSSNKSFEGCDEFESGFSVVGVLSPPARVVSGSWIDVLTAEKVAIFGDEGRVEAIERRTADFVQRSHYRKSFAASMLCGARALCTTVPVAELPSILSSDVSDLAGSRLSSDCAPRMRTLSVPVSSTERNRLGQLSLRIDVNNNSS